MTDQEIERIYLRHRTPFKAWAVKQFSLRDEEALDVYQEAIVTFVRNVRNGKYDPTSCEPSTYLFAIGRNLALKAIRAQRNNGGNNVLEVPEPVQIPEYERLTDELHAKDVLARGMEHLSEKEREILRLYYFEERSMADIAGIMGYNNSDVAKKMKYMSFRKLAALITKTMAPRRTADVE
ncbi:MAG: sigma-70 family RNA polymerase sigma factor [Flavobacteriales bacterium]|nr:sigma-70 family RNA polymerase sigma factor [Flavobacteriales bacterium]